MSRILVVDDEPAIGWSLREVLSDDGHAVKLAASVAAGLASCRDFQPEAMLLDVRLPDRDGLEALPEFRAAAPAAAVVVMTAFGDLNTAVRALDAGAFDYLPKPFDLATVAQMITRATAAAGQPDRAAAVTATAGSIAAKPATGELIGRSPPMQAVFRQIALVAPSELPVLITGPTGTGKELAAQALHRHSRRRDRPLITAHLAALAPTLIESELFGHRRGGFTGATRDHAGLFERADGGTIFLDEIGEASPDVQVKLLRVLESGEILPVGAAAGRQVDVRIVAATNRDLAAAVTAGSFRADLFHRLRGFAIEMPPLAERLDDIPDLVDHFLATAARRAGPTSGQISAGLLEALAQRPWPGNIRELRHAIEHALVLARGGPLGPEHLPAPVGPALAGGGTPSGTCEEALVEATRRWLLATWQEDAAGDLHERAVGIVEGVLAREAVRLTDGNRTAAARRLGLDRATLRNRLGGE
jgi:DNA-binding NtrC family response regulator